MYILAMISLIAIWIKMCMNNIVKIGNSVILLLRSTEEICMFVNVAFIAAEVRRICWNFLYLLYEYFVKLWKWFEIVVPGSISYDLFYITCFPHPKKFNKICLIKKNPSS